ncbi:DUF3889 domain-containing protein [Sporosarcina quadrami]|nr:DUF3889 domain-containing protein [Sporosarcina quadrami]
MKLLLAISMLFIIPATYIAQSTIAEEKEIPAYAKWSRLALEETTKKYPNAKIIDYLYIGTASQEEKTIATFQLWMKENNKEFGVRVKVTYDTLSEQFVHVEFEEFARN